MNRNCYAILLHFTYGWDFINSENIELMSEKDACDEIQGLCEEEGFQPRYTPEDFKVVCIAKPEVIISGLAYDDYSRLCEGK